MIKNYLLFLLIWGLGIQFLVAQGGASCSEATVAKQGVNVSNNFEGDQWFVYTATMNGKVTVSSCGMTSANTMVEIYDSCDEEAFTSSDDFIDEQSEVTFEVMEGLSYLINWKGDYTADEYEWTLEENTISEGESCGYAIVVTASEELQTSAPQNKYRWYQFTATRNGKVTVTSLGDNTDDCRVAVFEDCSYTSSLNNDESWNDSKIAFDAVEGQDYLICWQNGSDSDSIEWKIEESDWKTGERCIDPIDIDVSQNNTIDHESATNKWYRFIPKGTGEMTVSSASLTSEDTYLEIYEGCGGTPVRFSDDSDGLQSEITMDVTEGKAYYIKWDKLYTPDTYAWSLKSTYVSAESAEVEEQGLKVYPNPTTGVVNVDLTEYESNTVVAIVMGVAGNIVDIKRLSGGVVATFNISKLKPGVYQIMFTDLVSREVVRVVKE